VTFKENCPDIRNTRVIDMIHELRTYHANVEVYDPWAHKDEAREELGLELVAEPEKGRYEAIIVATGHDQFVEMGAEGIRALGTPDAVLFDVKGILPKSEVDGRL